MRKMQFRFLYAAVFIAIFILSAGSGRVHAQTQTPDSAGPVYIVQSGDTLWSIAVRFRISMDDLASANGISDTSQLAVGASLTIPGLEGIQGELTTQTVGLGESLESISRQSQVPFDLLLRINRMTSPAELYVGSQVILPMQNAAILQSNRSVLKSGESLLELAILHGENPWTYSILNGLQGTWGALPGEILQLPAGDISENTSQNASAFPDIFTSVQLSAESLLQGKAAVIEIAGPAGIILSGSLDNYPLSFFEGGQGHYYSLQGIHAMMDPGLYVLTINAVLPSETPGEETIFSFNQSVLVSAGNYPFDPVLTVSPETIDPAVTKPEDAQWAALTATATPEKLWKGIFTSPVPPPFSDCYPSLFGNRRSYNGSEYSSFHTGLDFCGGVGTEILAPADGRVVFTGPLTVRGNATIIDHGWGIYSGYLHQSEILVQIGENVSQGQLIGKVGGTGRATGPHLHWEIWVGGVQVDPLDWLSQEFPFMN